MNIDYIEADKLLFDPRPQMGRIFAHGFYQWLKYFSKDAELLSEAFEHIFDLSRFFVAKHSNEIIAITACTDGKAAPIRLDRKTLCRVLGCIRGSIAYIMLTKHLVNHAYPFELPPQTLSIEFVATAQEHRGKGAAYGLIAHIMGVIPHAEYVLEVADTNEAAVRLYEKAGFVVFERVPAPKRGGFNYYLYMKTVGLNKVDMAIGVNAEDSTK